MRSYVLTFANGLRLNITAVCLEYAEQKADSFREAYGPWVSLTEVSTSYDEGSN